MKKCNKCNIEKDESEYYFRNDTQKFRDECKVCHMKVKGIYYRLNKTDLLAKAKIYKQKNIEKFKKYNRTRKENKKEEILLSSAKRRAKLKGIEFSLKLEDIKIPDICPVLGIPLFLTSGQRTYNSPSVDRIDNNKGYSKDNIIVISWRANRLKSDGTIEEIIKLANFLKQYMDTT